MADYYSLQKLAAAAPMGVFLHCSAEAKAREEFCKEVIELFGNDVGMARKLLGELLPLRAQHSNMVFRNKVLRERHDLPVDRLPVHGAVVALQAERDQLKAENEALRKALRTIRDESSDLGACECAADALTDSRKEASHE